MSTLDLSGRTEISGEGIKKHFKHYEAQQAIFELIWNGFDADASQVNVIIRETELEATDLIEVIDNGTGIDAKRLAETFGRFNDSHKKADLSAHGHHGRGRLAFHRVCTLATWHSKTLDNQVQISIDARDIKHYNAKLLSDQEQTKELKAEKSGTVVRLENFYSGFPTTGALRELSEVEFGWYIALSQKQLHINSTPVTPPANEHVTKDVELNGHSFKIDIFRWHKRPTSEKSYIYLLAQNKRVVHKELSSFNNKLHFYTSIYVSSIWNENFSASGPDLANPSANGPDSDELRKLRKIIDELLEAIHKKFLAEQVEEEILKYHDDGIFPSYTTTDSAYNAWRKKNIESVFRTTYLADPTLFSQLNKKQRKILVRLLDRLSISSENEGIFEILNSVLDLPEESTRALAAQLKRTTLDTIISTIETLQKRHDAAAMLRVLMNEHYLKVKETPDLQRIIENNTWLFGSRYETIGAEEDTFTAIVKELRSKVKGITAVESEDLDERDREHFDGCLRQPDLFLARKFPELDSTGREVYRCILIEIKRPSIALNIKHLRQLDDYAAIIAKHPEFKSEKLRFELILVGRKISDDDYEISSRLKNMASHQEPGLVSEDARMKRYIFNWYTLLDSFELSNNFMLQQLSLKRDVICPAETDALVSLLQAPH